MAHLWVEQGEEWGMLPLHSDRLLLTSGREQPVRKGDWRGAYAGALHPVGEGGAEWAILCKPGALRVNGERMPLGIRVLVDRDELVVPGGARLFYSSERLAAIVPFSGTQQTTFCPRCLEEIGDGTPAVRCPRCGVAYHENAESGLTCWTYGLCVCGQETALDAGFRWHPDEL